MDKKAVFKEAFEIQEEIAREKKAIKEKEWLLQNLLWQLEKENVGRLGDYERKKKITIKRIISSEKFRARWPELFNKLAKVTLKDAQAEVREVELNEVCSTFEQVSWKIIFYGRLEHV
jgi:hypothetical protein